MSDLNQLVAGEVLSVRRDSIVLRVQRGSSYQICKSYHPEGYLEYRQQFGAFSFRIKSHYRDEQAAMFNHEAAVLQALSSLPDRVVPELLAIDKDTLSIYLEYVPQRTFQEEFLVNPHRARSLTEELVLVLAKFHNYTAQHVKEIIDYASFEGKPRVRERKPEEDIHRWRNYLETIIYHCSSDFQEYWKNNKFPPPEKLQPKTVRHRIRKFLHEKNIDLSDLVQNFILRDREIIKYGGNASEAVFISGDFGPQNVFYLPEEKKSIKIFDFDKARLGPRDIDLIHAIYHIHHYPFHRDKEVFSLELAREYFETVKVSRELLAERMAGLIASRLKENVRLFAVYCQMNPFEVRKFVGERPEYANLENGNLWVTFLENMFVNHFRDFLDYYRYRFGEGWELAVEKPLHSGERKEQQGLLLGYIRDQFRSIESFFTQTGVIRGKVTSHERERKLEKILTFTDN